jgi:phosphodiesterase/alkaline phosphatase D-like protein
VTVLRAIAAGAAVIVLMAGASPLTTARLLVTVGEVTPASAVVWVRDVARGDVALEYGPVGGERERARIAVRAADDLTGKLRLERLLPATRYGYRLTGRRESRTGEFVTAPAADATPPSPSRGAATSGGRDSAAARRRAIRSST